MRRRLTYIVLILLLSLLFSGCSDTSAAFEQGGAEPDTDYDFSVYLTGVGDPIRLNTLIEEYERKTGLDIEIITTQDGEASDRTLWRRLNAQEPPAVFTVDTQTDTARIAEAGIIKITDGDGTEGLEDIESAIPVRLKTMGFAADKKLLADLIAQEDSDRFISDLKAADYPEWNTFIITLGGYITEGTAADFKLNRHSYRFADKKSELTAGLTGVFAEPGADLSFIGRRLLDRTLATTDPVRWTDSSAELAAAAEAAAGATESVSGAGIAALTGAAFSAAAALTDNVFGAYAEALSEITGSIAGLYAPGIRGDDFIDEEYYSEESAARIFAAGRAVFTDVSETDYKSMKEAAPEQALSLVLFPVKIPYLAHGLDPVAGGVAANSAVPVRVTGALCVNESLAAAKQAQAQEFAEWFVRAENYDGNTLMREAAGYFAKGDVLPYAYSDEAYDDQMSYFVKALADPEGLSVFLADSKWDEEKMEALRLYLKDVWSGVYY